MKPLLFAGLLTACALSAAQAHTPYLHAIGEISGRGGLVALEAAFAETFFVPEVAFDNSRFQVQGPDGATVMLEGVHTLKGRTVAEYRLGERPGSYRFSTGLRHGAVFRSWDENGERKTSRDPAVRIPAHATAVSGFQALTLAETYVSVGKPDCTALAARGKGLELVALDHPDDLYAGERFRFTVQYDGKPLAGQKVEITEAVWNSGRSAEVVTLVTDAQGAATFNLDRAGTWVALTRHRTPAPADAGVDEYSHSYTLSFRVLEQ